MTATPTERKAEYADTVGLASRYLFARHLVTGHRITSRQFYRRHQGGTMERDGYVLMTTLKSTIRNPKSAIP